MSTVEKHEFQAEVQQILHLMIHSLYTNKEIFLRELVSNASDAIDKLRFLSLTDTSLMEDVGEPMIEVLVDEDQKSITIKDNGIGMSYNEVVENIGTIARSGTKEFVNALSGEQANDAQLIGQFGVGFYSAFLVARKVVLTTRKAGSDHAKGVRWVSEGTGAYTIEEMNRAEPGTTITLFLTQDEADFASGWRLRSIISKYSDHISIPICMVKEAMGGDEDDKEKSDEIEYETVNKGSALWTRPRNEITEEEYNNFYTTLSYDSEAPLLTLHNRVEGNLEYTTLFYLPTKAPFDLWDRERRHGINLYVRRVFIMDDSEHLMPPYLRFVRGVVDAQDLPLNVSREYLQKNREIDKISRGSVKKILGELKKLAKKEPEKYLDFWNQFGKVIKEGIVDDYENKNAIAGLLRFSTTSEDDQKVSLDEYIKRMPMKQKSVYYITAESHAAAKASPHLEIFKKKGIEVLLLSDHIDEWLVTHLTEYEEKPLKSVAKGDLDDDEIKADEDSEKAHKKKTEEMKGLTDAMQEKLSAMVKEVRLSQRLTDSPACLIADEHDMGGNLQRILQAAGQDAPESKPILELNADHPIISALNPDSADLEDWAHVLLDQATLSEGAPLKEPAAYVQRVNRLLGAGI